MLLRRWEGGGGGFTHRQTNKDIPLGAETRFSLNAFASFFFSSEMPCQCGYRPNKHTHKRTENDKVHKQIFNVLGLLMLVFLSECQSAPLFMRDHVSVSGQAEKLPRMNLFTD